VRRLEPAYHAKRGHERAACGDLQGAIRAYEAALALDRESSVLYLHLGYAFERVSRWSNQGDPRREESLRRAAVCYRQVTDRSPLLRREALLRLAQVHAPGELGDVGALEVDLEALVRVDPSSADWALALAWLREDSGRAREAEAVLLAARRARPDAAAIHRELARFYRRHQRIGDSVAALRRRLQDAPEDREALFALTEVSFYRAYRDHRLGEEQRRASVTQGLRAAGRLLRLEPHHVAATRYQALLLGLNAKQEGAGE
jgi:tetratricopeptide (TPR) repeat protein